MSSTLVASVLTLLPAMGLVYYVLHRYEGYFQQNRLFLALTVGLFSGLLVKFLEVNLFQFDLLHVVQGSGAPYTTGTLMFSWAMSTFGYALIIGLAMTAVLGFRTFRARKDTPYYGVSHGLAFGAMHTMALFALTIEGVVQPKLRLDGAALVAYGVTMVFATGLIMIHGAAAVWIGRGSAGGRLWKGMLQGTLLLCPALFFSWLWSLDNLQGVALLGVVPTAIVTLGYGIFLTLTTQKRILDTIVPPEIRDQLRRERRRELRKGGA